MNASFPRSDEKKSGYRTEQVDAFLDRARRSYDGSPVEGEPVTAAELRTVSFDLQKGGYSARFVDAALDRLEDVFFERERRQQLRDHGEDAWRERVRELALEIRGRVTQPKGKRFRRSSVITSGYKRTQVDAFLDKVAGFLDGRNGLTPLEVRDVTFHTELRGYNEDQVDLFLDAVVELILSRR